MFIDTDAEKNHIDATTIAKLTPKQREKLIARKVAYKINRAVSDFNQRKAGMVSVIQSAAEDVARHVSEMNNYRAEVLGSQNSIYRLNARKLFVPDASSYIARRKKLFPTVSTGPQSETIRRVSNYAEKLSRLHASARRIEEHLRSMQSIYNDIYQQSKLDSIEMEKQLWTLVKTRDFATIGNGYIKYTMPRFILSRGRYSVVLGPLFVYVSVLPDRRNHYFHVTRWDSTSYRIGSCLTPHAKDGEDGVCFGNAGYMMKNCLSRGRIMDAVLIAEAHLRTYNPDSPYIAISTIHDDQRKSGFWQQWSGQVGTKSTTNPAEIDVDYTEEHEDEVFRCDSCGDEVDEDDMNTCTYCGAVLCGSCVHYCEPCGESYCEHHSHEEINCNVCGLNLCTEIDSAYWCEECGHDYCYGHYAANDDLCCDCLRERRQQEAETEPEPITIIETH